jgi:predicted enzyme related to lactoylglutathione lyase
MNPVVHFEMPYDDSARMARFYGVAFGWHMQTLGAEMGHYVTATTTGTDPGGAIRPGSINGGFFARAAGWPALYPSIVIAVDDIQDAIAQVTKAGGKVLDKPMDIPGIGRYVSFTDTEDNRVGMLQALPPSG